MNLTNRLRVLTMGLWGPILAYVSGIGLIVFLLGFQLGRLVPGLSVPEANLLTQSQGLHMIVHNPINLPFKLLEFGLLRRHHATPPYLRLISASFAFVIVCLFYYTLRRWYAQRTAVLGTILFVSSSWFLHFARLATPDILYTSLVAAMAYGTWLGTTKKSSLAMFVGALLGSLMLYVPGLIWVVVIAGVWQYRAIFDHYKRHTLASFFSMILVVALLLPLLYGLILHPVLIRTLLGLQSSGIPHPLVIFKNIAWIPVQLLYRANANPVVWLGTLPLLDIFASAMLLLGIYTHYFLRRLDRARMLVGSVIICSILFGFGQVNLIILMPFVYMLITTGLALLLRQWFTVFPRNPLARVVGTSLLSLAVLLAAFYHINQYFIAWPNAPSTKQVFQIKQ